MIIGVLLYLASLNAATAAPKFLISSERGGKVCIADAADFRRATHCRSTERPAFDAELNGYFLWRSDRNTSVWLGKSERGSRVALDPAATAMISLRIRHADARNAAKRETTLTLRSGSGATWTIPFTAEKIEQLRVIALPAGKYDFAISTSGYFPAVRRGVDAREGIAVELPAIEIERVPGIIGVVRDGRTGEAIAGAEIKSDDAVTSTDAAGRFTFIPSAKADEAFITVRASGYASREIAVRLSRAGSGLEPILLTRGGSLRLTVHRECADDCETTARLFVRRDSLLPSNRWSQLERKNSSDKNAEYRFAGLADGQYAVLIEGKGPLQRKVAYVEIARDELTEETVALHDTVLKGIVTLGDSPLTKAKLTFSTNQSLWSSELQTDVNGEYSATLWESGTWILSVDVATERQRFVAVRSLNESAEQFWDVPIPARAITGRVFDAKTKEPVVGATILDDVVSETPSSFQSITDTDGRFRLPMLDAGNHTIHVQAPGFLDHEPIDVQLARTDTQRELQIGLDRGIAVFFRIVDSNGAPVASAAVYDWVGHLGLENRIPYASDPWGLVSVPLHAGEQKQIYVLARSGLFSVALADSSTKTTAEKPIDITLPPPSAALTLIATDKSGAAAGVRFLVRVDGRFLPPRIWDLATGSGGSTATMTGRDGRLSLPALPLGTYEFWPYRTVDELRVLVRLVHTKKPTRAVLGPGQNVVEIAVDGGK